MGDTRPPCIIPDSLRGPDGCVPLHLLSSGFSDCEFVFNPEQHFCFSSGVTVQDEHGHVVDGDNDPLAKHGCKHKSPHTHEVRPMEHETPAPEVSTTTATPVPAPAVTTSTVEVDHAIGQVKSLVPDAGPGLMIAGAATLAVVGAAIKFVPQWMKGKQELEAKRIEAEQSKAESEDDKHQKCSAERMALEAKVVALQGKLDEVAAKAEKAGSASMSLDGFDPDELEKRLVAIEKKLKASNKKKA